MKKIFKILLIIIFIVAMGIIGKQETKQNQKYYNFCINTYGENITKEVIK